MEIESWIVLLRRKGEIEIEIAEIVDRITKAYPEDMTSFVQNIFTNCFQALIEKAPPQDPQNIFRPLEDEIKMLEMARDVFTQQEKQVKNANCGILPDE